MKKLAVIIVILSLIIVSGCTSNNNDDQVQSEEYNKTENTNSNENLINEGEITKGQWIDGYGESQDNSEMINVGPITYVPNKSYSLNRTAYVSYYNGDTFLETILYDYKNEFPLEIESIEDADNIFVSFNEKNIDIMELSEE